MFGPPTASSAEAVSCRSARTWCICSITTAQATTRFSTSRPAARQTRPRPPASWLRCRPAARPISPCNGPARTIRVEAACHCTTYTFPSTADRSRPGSRTPRSRPRFTAAYRTTTMRFTVAPLTRPATRKPPTLRATRRPLCLLPAIRRRA